MTDKENAPKMINEIKLINGGKILENNRTISEARSLPICELPGIVTTMHVVLRPPIFDPKKGNFSFNTFLLIEFSRIISKVLFLLLLFSRKTPG